jgi:hypothetical protein
MSCPRFSRHVRSDPPIRTHFILFSCCVSTISVSLIENTSLAQSHTERGLTLAEAESLSQPRVGSTASHSADTERELESRRPLAHIRRAP